MGDKVEATYHGLTRFEEVIRRIQSALTLGKTEDYLNDVHTHATVNALSQMVATFDDALADEGVSLRQRDAAIDRILYDNDQAQQMRKYLLQQHHLDLKDAERLVSLLT
jgi:uncharacterized protein (DUF4213/DUF364 family)